MRLDIPDDRVNFMREFIRIGADKAVQDVIADANAIIAAIDKACACEQTGYDCVCEGEVDGQSER